MKPVVTLLFAVLVVAGVVAKPPTRCCYPDQYEIDDGQIVGTVQGGRGVTFTQTVKIATDYLNNRLGEFVTTYFDAAPPSYLRLVLDYNKGAEYIINDVAKTCQKVAFAPSNMTQCIPDDAKFLGTSYLGNNQITGDTFSYYGTEGPPGTDGHFTVQVTKDTCIPLSITFVGHGLLVAAGLSNFVNGILDPSVYFDVPSYCPTGFSNDPQLYKTHRYLLFQ